MKIIYFSLKKKKRHVIITGNENKIYSLKFIENIVPN